MRRLAHGMPTPSSVMAPIALLSVSDKHNLLPLAKGLTKDHGYTIISSGGTAKALEEASIPVQRVADYTGAPEILGGRVKTLHPRIHGGILSKKDNPQTMLGVFEQKIFNKEHLIDDGSIAWLAIDRVRDPGNLGTIFRTCNATGIKTVIL